MKPTTRKPSRSEPTERALPSAPEIERAVLGSCIQDDNARRSAALVLNEESFYLAQHKVIWRALAGVNGEHLDLPILSQKLRDAGRIEDVGGEVYLCDCMMAAPTTALLEDHVAVLQEKETARRGILGASELLQAFYDGESNPARLASIGGQMFHDIAAGIAARRTGGLKHLPECAKGYEQWTRRVSAQSAVIDLGDWLPSLRRPCGNLVGGELVTVIGGTGVGKTAIAQNVALKMSPHRVALFEMELPERLTYPRFHQIIRKMSLADVHQAHKEGISEGWEQHPELQHIHLCSDAGLSVAEIERRVMALSATGEKVQLVIVDYFQLLRGQGNTRYERFSNEAEAAKVAAKRTDAVWLLISQIDRETQKEGGEPHLFSAKESGAVENSSGLVLGAWRDERMSAKIHMRVLKNTKGASGLHVECNFEGECLRISEIPPEMPEQEDFEGLDTRKRKENPR